jgi:tungstate transport system substrate-binding protein
MANRFLKFSTANFLLGKAALVFLIILGIWSLWGGGGGEKRLRLATTTSTENSGLLDTLLPPFEKRFGAKIDIIPVGTGKALRLGAQGDVDVILVHAPEAEERFVSEGHGVNRRDVMYNRFVLIGPSSDPAGVKGLSDGTEALVRIEAEEAPFVSRGDDSGTHKKERALWVLSGVNPKGNWYLEIGQGMGATLLMASQKEAYTLTDIGTFLVYGDRLDLEVLVDGDPQLRNPYGIIAVNPARHLHINYPMAMALIGWITSPAGQEIIRDFRPTGEPLFNPMTVP